jgi:hypothetical protein
LVRCCHRAGHVPWADNFSACFSPQACPFGCQLTITKISPQPRLERTCTCHFPLPPDCLRAHLDPPMSECRTINNHPLSLPTDAFYLHHMFSLHCCLGLHPDSLVLDSVISNSCSLCPLNHCLGLNSAYSTLNSISNYRCVLLPPPRTRVLFNAWSTTCHHPSACFTRHGFDHDYGHLFMFDDLVCLLDTMPPRVPFDMPSLLQLSASLRCISTVPYHPHQLPSITVGPLFIGHF